MHYIEGDEEFLPFKAGSIDCKLQLVCHSAANLHEACLLFKTKLLGEVDALGPTPVLVNKVTYSLVRYACKVC